MHCAHEVHLFWTSKSDYELTKLTPGCIIIFMLIHTQSVSSHIVVVTTVICKGPCSLLSLRKTLSILCLFSAAMLTDYPLKENFQASLIDFYRPIVFRYNAVVSAWVNLKISFTFASVCNLWELTCSLSTLESLTLSWLCATKILYRIYLFRSIFATYIFGQVVVTTKHADQLSTC